MTSRIQFHLLHSKEQLLEDTAALVNQEWPRSMAARIASIEDGCDELPCSMVMTEQLEASESLRVIGHARLMPVAECNDAALIESVIVLPELRGKGLGRLIMEEAERHLLKTGYKSVHLSTHDKQGFYSRLGYVSGPVVSGRRKCVANWTTEQAQSVLGFKPSGSKNVTAVISTPTQLEYGMDESRLDSFAPVVASSAPPPPPPPPPPRLLDTSQTVNSQIVTWMVKSLS